MIEKFQVLYFQDYKYLLSILLVVESIVDGHLCTYLLLVRTVSFILTV